MAEWKKVIVSGSQAELNSLDLKGSSGELKVTGNTQLSGSLSIENRAAEQILYAGANGLITGSNKLRFEESGGGRGIHFASASADGSGNPSDNVGIYGVQVIKMSKDGGGGIISQTANAALGNPGTSGIAFGPAGGASDGHADSVSLYSNTGGAGFDARNDGNLTLRTSGATRLTIGDTNSTFSNNLLVQGNTTLGNATSDKTEITGSTNLLGTFKILRNTNANQIPFTVNSLGNVFINPKGTSYYAFIGTESFFKDQNGDNADLSINNYDIVSNKSLVLGHGKTDVAWGKALTVTGSTGILGSLRVDGTLTVTGDTLQEDLRTTGITRLGDDMTDKTEITGSLNVTGSSIFDGPNATVTIDPSSTTVLNIQDNGGSSTEALKLVKSNGTEMISLANQGSEATFRMKDNGGDSISLSSKQSTNSFHLPNFAIGASSTDANNTLSVTGNIKATTGITGSYLTNDNILIAGSAGEVESSGITWNGTTLDVGAGNITSTGDLTITDARINGDLVVTGTASFENTENLKVTDRFISLASGSTGTGDGGIVIQQAASGLGEVFGFDNANGGRWGLRASFDATASLFTPTDFMVTTAKAAADPTVGTSPTYGGTNGHGNMHVNTSTGDIFIYA